MTDLESRIQALSDAEAITLLRRFVRAMTTGSPTPETLRQQALLIVNTVTLPADPGDPMGPGDLARSALLLLASDARFQSSVNALLSSVRGAFSRGTEQIEAADLLAVLQTQFPSSSAGATTVAGAGADQQAGLVRTLTRHLLSYAGIQQQGPQADAEYRVWYATSRKPLTPAEPSRGFGAQRDTRIHHGTCRVFVPRSHKVGSTGSAWWKRLVTATDDRMRLLAIDTLEEPAFWQQMRNQLAQCAADDQDAVVFIHGFNVDFQEAALRAAQIGFDLQIRGAMAFYSWASRGDVKMYLADEDAIQLDEAPIADFLCDMAQRTGARRVHVIAHSMGNRAVLRAVHQITLQVERRSSVRFGQIILAAADVNALKFQELCQAYRLVSERTTLYVSSRDAAVEVSRRLHDFPRVGSMPPVTTAPGIDTVNAVNADVSLLGHGYVAEARDVIGDIHALIRHGAAPEQRFGLRQAKTPAGETYWMIGA